MKSRIKFILVSVVLIISIVGYVKIRQSEYLSPALLENVEALADDENGVYIECYMVGSLDCPINGAKVKEIYVPYRLSH